MQQFNLNLTIKLILNLLILSALAACGGNANIQALRFNGAPWADGEVSVYEVTDLNEQYAGTAQFTIIAGGDQVSESGWTIYRVINAQGETEMVEVQVDTKSLRPKFASLMRTKEDTSQRVETIYDGSQADLTLTTDMDVTTYERINIPSDARDQRTLLQLVRALPLESRYATRISSFLPITGVLQRVVLSVSGQEQVSVPAGSFQTWHIQIDEGEIQSEAWVHTERPYQLIKFIDGRTQGTFELTEYQAAGS